MVTAANFFNVLKPQMVRNALDLVVDNLQIFHLYDGFDLQTTFFQEFGKTLLFFGVLVLILALIQGIFMYFMRQTIIVMSIQEFVLHTLKPICLNLLFLGF